ncbi:DUF3604 domain-containing protein [Lutimonas zeaxanthinifaciens]|uniref:DUF3604 domain-containing protein n=1 Tax=Lutimonas zeaxanthinifaciens TaxID=3060215 RepID=UPI00265C9AFD|nr:DUF3604 domain-containing protein [Lutimonas sp. YSD2104]WKK67430.1 DUF3604 domain-containing protein [Lutimonas sp. YSD2104]
MRYLSLFLLSMLFFISCENEKKQDITTDENLQEETTSTTSESYPTEVYFGDTHLHTDLSMDAGAFGNRIGMDEAYQFARGDEVTSSTGIKTKLSKPLDFLVVADHSDGMGFFPDLMAGKEHVMQYEESVKWKKLIDEGKGGEAAIDIIKTFSQGNFPFKTNEVSMMTPVWKNVVDAAEKYNDPGKFTAFIGYEWTSLIKGNNLHRVVIYRDNGDVAIKQLPFTNEDSSDPERLWDNLESYEKNTGGKVLAIPHNGNLSNGMMFAETTVSGKAYDKKYVDRRARWEPLYEATQIKGDGEAHPFLSPNDEFADYENWDKGNLDMSEAKTNEMLEYEYTRSALKLGLKFKKELGTNPYKFGLIGSTDSHTSLATGDEDNFFGKASNVEPGKDRWNHPFLSSDKGTVNTWETVASGYAAVWAQENTRASLWDAMMRKETYATTGSRMKVRFFGGWEYTKADLGNEMVKMGYEKGVPMGGDLAKGEGKSPTFLVYALMDPDRGSLDRIQIVKGWVSEDGNLNEKVYDVAWSGDRKPGADGKVPSVGNTVNTNDATWDNSIGATELKNVWTDPEFDPAAEAFYYVRVIEIPTPRWTLYDKIRYGAELSEEVPLTTTERAYTSPIWYSPTY